MGIEEIRETTESCKHCFMCRHACPTFLATKLDSHTPRGYALLLSGIDHGYQTWKDSIIERFYQCSRCGLCREDCAYHWAEDEVVRNAREEIVSGNLAPAKVSAVASSIMKNHSPYGEKGRKSVSGGCVPDRQNADILYYAGCATRESHPEIMQAMEKLLGAFRADWTVLHDEGCCGASLFDLGYTKEAHAIAEELARKVRERNPRLLLTGCAHCFRAFRELFPSWGVSLPKSISVMHTSQYLDLQLEQGSLKTKRRGSFTNVSYHDPCQLGRKLGVFDSPRKLIAAATGSLPLEIFHSREKAECCGAGSSMFMTDPALTQRIARVRIARMREIESRTIVTACQNCKLAFQTAASDEESELQVLDIAELMAQLV
jgi:Fe-S oxidoreductase